MWVIAGVLLGLVVLVSLVGFHLGPHVHVAAAACGLVAGAWFVWMAFDGRGSGVWNCSAQTWSCPRASAHWPGKGCRCARKTAGRTT